MMQPDFKLVVDFFEFEYLKSANAMSGDDVISAIYDGAQEHIQDLLRHYEAKDRPKSYYKQLKRKRKIGKVDVHFMPAMSTYPQSPSYWVTIKVIRPKKIKKYGFSCERIQHNLVDKMLSGE